jgi:predicted Zn-dependent peptidase
MMLVQSGVDPQNEPKARRLILQLTREVAGGSLDEQAFSAVREAARARVVAMQDERGSTLSYTQEMLALGLDPRPRKNLDALLAVTPADVRRAGKALALEASFFLTSSPTGSPTSSAGAARNGAAS